MFKEMHKVRNMYLARLHERLARDLMRQRMGDDADRYTGLPVTPAWLWAAHPVGITSGLPLCALCWLHLVRC